MVYMQYKSAYTVYTVCKYCKEAIFCCMYEIIPISGSYQYIVNTKMQLTPIWFTLWHTYVWTNKQITQLLGSNKNTAYTCQCLTGPTIEALELCTKVILILYFSHKQITSKLDPANWTQSLSNSFFNWLTLLASLSVT